MTEIHPDSYTLVQSFFDEKLLNKDEYLQCLKYIHFDNSLYLMAFLSAKLEEFTKEYSFMNDYRIKEIVLFGFGEEHEE